MNVTSTTSTGAAAGAAASAAGTDTATQTSDRFLTLLVSQLKNQDPLNPMDNAQVTSQLAQINTVQGIQQLNGTVQTLVGRIRADESLQALAAVGHQAMVSGNTMSLANGSATAGFALPQSADSVVVNVRDANGQIVHTVDLGAHQSGTFLFAWDGITDSGAPAADGTYSFDITAKSSGQAVSVDRLTLARVDGVMQGADGAMLSLAGMAPVALSDVRRIL